MAVVYFAARLTHTDYISAGKVLNCLRAHAAMCALGIVKLQQHPADTPAEEIVQAVHFRAGQNFGEVQVLWNHKPGRWQYSGIAAD